MVHLLWFTMIYSKSDAHFYSCLFLSNILSNDNIMSQYWLVNCRGTGLVWNANKYIGSRLKFYFPTMRGCENGIHKGIRRLLKKGW